MLQKEEFRKNEKFLYKRKFPFKRSMIEKDNFSRGLKEALLPQYYPTLAMLCATSIPSYSTNQNNQPASQPASLAGRPVNTVLTGRMDKPKQSTSQPASLAGRPVNTAMAHRPGRMKAAGRTAARLPAGRPGTK